MKVYLLATGKHNFIAPSEVSMFKFKAIAPQAAVFKFLLRAALEGRREQGDPEVIYGISYQERRVRGRGGQHTVARLDLIREDQVLWSLVYDPLAAPGELLVHQGESLVGTVQGTPEEFRRVLEALKDLWVGFA